MTSYYQGIIFALLASAIWAISYVLPLYVPDFSSLEITLGRYMAYGFLSLALWFLSSKRPKITPKLLRLAVIFALTGNVVYYGLEVLGIKMIGAPLVTIIYATAPVMMSVWSNFQEKEFPFSLLLLPLTLMAVGVFCIHLQDFKMEEGLSNGDFVLGLLVVLLAIVMWVWYALQNSAYLKQEGAIGSGELSSLIGIACLVCSIFAAAGALIVMPEKLYILSEEVRISDFKALLWVSLVLGIVVSWMGTLCWNIASKVLPMSLTGQIVVCEFLFGLLYVYLKEGRAPFWYEALGAFQVILGVMLSLRRINAYREMALRVD